MSDELNRQTVLDVPTEFVRPDYLAGTIANVPATVAALLDLPFAGLPPIADALWQPLQGGVERVVLLTLDALGWNLIERTRPWLEPFLSRAAVRGQLTSIFPSTTVAALSSLWTGVGPAQHGLVGLTLFLPQFATGGQMISFAPVLGRFDDALVTAGLDPETFLAAPGMATQLAAGGVATYSFKGREIVNSVLSRMHGRGAEANLGAISFSDMLTQMRDLLEARPRERLFISGYWPTIDTLSHYRGWTGTAVAGELRALVYQIQTELLDQLSAQARRGTVFLLLADHGQIATPPEQKIYIEDHPALANMLLMRPLGEPRVVYLFAKHGRCAEVVAYINTHLGEQMIAWPAADALAAGLLGPAPHAEQAAERIGDVIVALKAGHVLLNTRDQERRNPYSSMIARHGGMTRDEMLVPWLGFRLDA